MSNQHTRALILIKSVADDCSLDVGESLQQIRGILADVDPIAVPLADMTEDICPRCRGRLTFDPDPIAEIEAMGGRLHAEHYSLAWMLHTPGREPDVEIEGVAAAAASGMIVTADLRAAAARLLARVRGGGA